MKEKCFDSVCFIPGPNRGKYPHCHSIYIQGDGILIDPAGDRKRLMELKKTSGVKQVWLTHWHEDHFMHLDLFDDVPLIISEQDAPQLYDLDLFMEAYGFTGDTIREYWEPLLKNQFHYKPRKPANTFKSGEVIKLKTVTVEAIHTPGHTPGHYSFFFREPGVLFMGDYDLTPFGPWYGDRESSIQETIASVESLRQIPANIWITCHETGLFEKEPDSLWDNYLNVIKSREDKLLNLLQSPKTMDEIINACIVYGKPREPKEFFSLGEHGIMSKHIENLIQRDIVKEINGRFFIK